MQHPGKPGVLIHETARPDRQKAHKRQLSNEPDHEKARL